MSLLKKSVVWSTLAHVALLAALIFSSAFAPASKPKEVIQWLDLAPDLGQPPPGPAPGPVAPSPSPPAPAEPTPPAPAPPAPTPIPEPPVPTPAPEPQPAPEPPLPTPKPIPQPKPKPTPEPAHPPAPKTPPKPKTPPAKPAAPKVAVSTNRVSRVVSATGRPAPAAPHAPSVTPATGGASFDATGFSKNLLGKLQNVGGLVTAKGATGTGTSSAGSPNEFGWYFSLVTQEMHNAWDPPLGLPEGLVAGVLIRVEKTGAISKVSLANPSGNKSMDDSALAAAHRVKKLPPLPEELGDRFAEITVHFKVQKQ